MKKEVIAWNPPTDWVQECIKNAGNTIGSVHFYKRTNGELRKMSYRLHVQNPSVASVPHGSKLRMQKSKKDIDRANTQMTVLDTNKVVRNKAGKIVGRGAWRTVPLEKVVRITNRGTVFTIKRDKSNTV